MNEFWSVLAGGIGVVAALVQMVAQHCLTNRRGDGIDKVRKQLLATMLKNAGGDGWMTIETLSRVVGAESEATMRLLLEIGASGSQKEREVWSLISRYPLPTGS
jgi:hypothetical protein